MASNSRYFTRHVVVTLVLVTLAAVGATLCICAACTTDFSRFGFQFSHVTFTLLAIVFVVLWLWMIRRLWKLIRLPLRQTEYFVGAMESRDTTMRFPGSDDPVLGTVLDDMNRVLRAYCADRFAMESQRQYYDRILRVMTHELRNSVTPIISLTDWMQSNTISNEDMKESLTIIHQQADGIRSFLSHYQELTHLPEPLWADFSVRVLFDGLRVALSGEPDANRIHFDISPQGADLIVHADEKLIRLALLNIIRNALHAIEGQADGHVSLLASGSPADGIRIVVSNNGPLIPPAQMELIFQPFYSTKKEGTGIGLALSRRIMELHGGTLTCDSNPPLTLFTLAFPA
ncbi:MAG: HAMP domain-containing histidine kinase [Bacteroidaceae bacterium]|nr:HAMP domain-containing histidine kinase [Bacteroidaceae bacterium]